MITILDERRLREAFGRYPTGVVAVCALVENEPAGLAVSSFTPVSLDPPLVSICIQNSSRTWPALRARPRLGISVLAAHQHEAGRRLAGLPAARFTGLAWHLRGDGAITIDDAIAWFDCSFRARVPAGDHSIELLTVHDMGTATIAEPLVFHGSRFRRLELADAPDASRSRRGGRCGTG